MKIGFIGAGKVGCTLGRYFVMYKRLVTGYYDINKEAALEAARLTDTYSFDSIEGIVDNSDIIFITVIDSTIESVWQQLKLFNIQDKIVCHCSGSLSSDIFSDIDQSGAYGYSVHPLFACCSKEDSYKDISKAIFTIEGNKEKLEIVYNLISQMGNKVQCLQSADFKAKYHCAAVMVSNQVIGLIKTGVDMLIQCGFEEDNAFEALKPLIQGNISNVMDQGVLNALTGPVERNDELTIKKHLGAINEEDKVLYKEISKKLVEIAKMKNPDRDYSEIVQILNN